MVKIPGVVVSMGGEDFEIPPLTLGALESLQKRIENFSLGALDAASLNTVIDAVFAALKRNYPDMTRERVSDLLDVGNMQAAFEAVMDISGLIRKGQGAEKPVAKS